MDVSLSPGCSCAPFASGVKVPQGWRRRNFQQSHQSFRKRCVVFPHVRVHVPRPRDHQGGHGLDTLVWSLLGSVSASLDRGGSSLERVHVAEAITCSDEDTDKQPVRLNPSFKEANGKTGRSGVTAEVQRSPEDKNDKREGRRPHR